MKTFLKMLLATILGGIILLFLGFIVIATFVSLADQQPEMKPNSILRIDIDNAIRERTQDNPFAAFDPISLQPESPLGLNQVLAAIKTAKDDDNIIGIYLNGGIPIAGNATLTEIRQALMDFRESEKFVYSFTEVMSQKGYYLVSAADSVFMLPEGFFEWSGLSASVTYLKEALDKLGVEPVVLRASGNEFKSAVEPFLRQDMSPENRLQLTELLHSVWDAYLQDISGARSLSAPDLNLLADSLAVTSPDQAYHHGFVDRLVYEDQILDHFLKKTGQEEADDLSMLSVGQYAKRKSLRQGKYGDDKIAVVIAQGDIVMGDKGEYQIGSERIAKAIRKAREDDKVKAIVLRVNSPGGSAIASEIIWREVKLAQQTKPVVASLGDVAASGGYYMSCFADTILAQPTTVTGSIGAFGLFFTGEELMNDKLGINIETVTTNRYSDLGTFDRSLTPGERRILINQVDKIYRTFLQRVSEGRDLPFEVVDSLGGGRVYSGTAALELGLVDLIGGVEDAIEVARNMAQLGDEYRVVEYPELEDPLMRMMKILTGDYEEQAVRKRLGEYARYFDLLKKSEGMQGMQTRMEYDLIID